MTISIYCKSLSKKLKPLHSEGGYPPPSALKGFIWGLLKRKGAWFFFLGISKIKLLRFQLRGSLNIRNRSKTDWLQLTLDE